MQNASKCAILQLKSQIFSEGIAPDPHAGERL